ncbi:YlmH/Sll1252 family protein [Clostridium malenominatum]|uniref:YlmH/Sll1252 family protein n=1 Tax=Clostridium malenominatum TaxID=1539 RepID=A0ABP3U9K5_9CLOT
MIDKAVFLNLIEYEDKNRLSNIYGKLLFAEKTNSTVYTEDFYPPNVWKVLERVSGSISVNVYSNGVFKDAERRIISFSSDEVWYYPIKLLKITNLSSFSVLCHRDYLGALMALGLKREKFGDLIIKDETCYLPVKEELSEYIITNLKGVGACPCKVEVVDVYDEIIPDFNFEEVFLIITSNRLDCIVSSLTKLSRTKAMEIIQNSKVLVDYVVVKDKDKTVEDGAIITIRGYGKFKYIGQSGVTGSGRKRVLFKKFV